MAKSEFYYGWSVTAMENVDSLKKAYKGHTSIP
jgi:hypothetical protein